MRALGDVTQLRFAQLLKRAFGLLVDQLSDNDKVSIVVYAGAAGMVLEPTHDPRKIRSALERLQSGGSTAGGITSQMLQQLQAGMGALGGTGAATNAALNPAQVAMNAAEMQHRKG